MRRILIAGFTAALGTLVACDRPTAPQVRESVEKTQNMLFSGRFQSQAAELQRQMDYVLERTKFFPTGLIEMERDGHLERYVATVMERVYLPPPESGGAPYTRRMLIAWDRESRRGIALAADDSEATVVFPSFDLDNETNAKRLWGRVGYVTQIENNGRDGWYGSEGAISFALGPAVASCKFVRIGEQYGFAFGERTPKSGEVCQEVRYRISAASTLEHRSPDVGPGILDRWTTSRITLRIVSQDLPGTRIVTQCPELDGKAALTIYGCGNRYNFWRRQDQFAPELGVDLSRMTRLGSGQFIQHWIAGSGPSFPCCAHMANAPIRYTISTPGGTVLRRAEVSDASKDSLLNQIRYPDNVVREGSRSLIFGIHLPIVFHQYTPLVFDVSILPCPAGMKRDDTSFMGNAYPTGGCYPVQLR